MQNLLLGMIYFIFFFSGVAALIYEVVWVRYLTLVFGGSHLAVTTVLAVFMGGLALGSYIIGKKIDNCKKLLRLYGLLELGIAVSALLFVALMKLYPTIYIFLAQVALTSPLYLTFIRISFAIIALIIPTTLMGGTLPVLSSFSANRVKGLGSRLSFLYGFNTIGAVAGAGLAGFVLLGHYSVSDTLAVAVIINVVIGILSIILQSVVPVTPEEVPFPESSLPIYEIADTSENIFLNKLVLVGIGVSGFCSMGYEILWTRIISIVVTASSYGFTLILMAFLTGIGLGSAAYGLFLRIAGALRKESKSDYLRSIFAFGLVQVLIGMSALIVTSQIRELPIHVVLLRKFLYAKIHLGDFQNYQLVNFAIAFSYMFVPAFFIGVAFPLAAKIYGMHKNIVGKAVGEVLAFNTIGAILGSAVSGFVLIYLLGIQRSLSVLILFNLGFGLLVMTSVWGKKTLTWGVTVFFTGAILVVAFIPRYSLMWDKNFFATYMVDLSEVYGSPERLRKFLDYHNRILYYAEGAQSIVSSVMTRDGHQLFLTNGRVEATNQPNDRQCQYTLGHLPMLLCKNPKKVFVLGAGSGMTLGAVSVYPTVEQITLAEIEPKVLGITRTFAKYNHNVLDNPKVNIVFNDGRNYLMTTKEKFDVITADPIHPWFSGTGYLYSNEYFKLESQHLNPGGLACQWLPIYELSVEDLQSVVKSFSANFKYTMVWLTHWDAELLGSNDPIVIDEEDLDQKIKRPEVLQDLEPVKMGSAEDFLSYFLAGNAGVNKFCKNGVINSDDNLYLEFSAPRSMDAAQSSGRLVDSTNCDAFTLVRESILPFLKVQNTEPARARQKATWERNLKAASTFDWLHAKDLARRFPSPECREAMYELDDKYPSYAPWKFLKSIMGQSR